MSRTFEEGVTDTRGDPELGVRGRVKRLLGCVGGRRPVRSTPGRSGPFVHGLRSGPVSWRVGVGRVDEWSFHVPFEDKEPITSGESETNPYPRTSHRKPFNVHSEIERSPFLLVPFADVNVE